MKTCDLCLSETNKHNRLAYTICYGLKGQSGYVPAMICTNCRKQHHRFGSNGITADIDLIAMNKAARTAKPPTT